MTTSNAWPAIAGTYQLGDPQGPVAVCALTSEALMEPLAHVQGVAIAGKVYTANLGIERIVVNVTANPAIRFCLVVGKDSPLFHPGQSLVALAEGGLDAQRRIVGAAGYDPVLPTVALERVAQFRQQVEMIDWSGEEDVRTIEQGIAGLVARNPGRFAAGGDVSATLDTMVERFASITPGGQREPLLYDPKGYFVITLDRPAEQIVLRHYLPDHTPAHEMRGRTAGPMVLGLLREGLMSQLSHAGYLGEELAKAQAALHLDLRYDQDRPLRARAEASSPPAATATPTQTDAMPPRMPPIAPPATWAELQGTAAGAEVNVVLAVGDVLAADLLGGALLEPDEAEPFNAFRRTPHSLRLRWSPATRIVMGGADDLRVSALVRARGKLLEGGQLVEAAQIAILTQVARIIE